MEEANEFSAHKFLTDFSRRFTVPARKAGNDNCARYKNRRSQLPRVTYRNHFVRHPAVVHEYRDGGMGVHDAQGRLVGKYDSEGRLVEEGPWKRKPSGSRMLK